MEAQLQQKVASYGLTLAVPLPRKFFRPPVRSNGRSYKMLVMFFFLYLFILSPRVLLGPSADRPETWPHERKLSEFYNPSSKIRGPSRKKSGAKNMQNFGRFYTTSDFDREYLRNGSRYLKSES